jgi:hypothetical protein
MYVIHFARILLCVLVDAFHDDDCILHHDINTVSSSLTIAIILLDKHAIPDTELATEVEKTIQQADGSAYMAIFTTTSTSGVPPAKYYKDAKIEIERCAKALDELADMIGLKL